MSSQLEVTFMVRPTYSIATPSCVIDEISTHCQFYSFAGNSLDNFQTMNAITFLYLPTQELLNISIPLDPSKKSSVAHPF